MHRKTCAEEKIPVGLSKNISSFKKQGGELTLVSVIK